MLPDSVNIFGLPFRVCITDCIDRHDAADGQIDFDEQVIKIWAGLSQKKREQVLLHEIVHGILEQLCFEDEREDERLVQGLAIGLHQALDPFSVPSAASPEPARVQSPPRTSSPCQRSCS